jgi:hypothetical protein
LDQLREVEKQTGAKRQSRVFACACDEDDDDDDDDCPEQSAVCVEGTGLRAEKALEERV